jgi:hypothetical protein
MPVTCRAQHQRPKDVPANVAVIARIGSQQHRQPLGADSWEAFSAVALRRHGRSSLGMDLGRAANRDLADRFVWSAGCPVGAAGTSLA